MAYRGSLPAFLPRNAAVAYVSEPRGALQIANGQAQIPSRSYTAAKEKVAKFQGTKGPNVRLPSWFDGASCCLEAHEGRETTLCRLLRAMASARKSRKP